MMSVVALAGCGDDKVAGENGINSIISTSAEPAGDNCVNGGTRIDIGPDANANGILEAEEVKETVFTCAGSDGAGGADGSDGEGFITLVDTSAEPPGGNCPTGGQRVDYGIDDNADGVLDAGEIDGTAFVCDGPSGLTTLVATSAEPAGVNCVAGGARLDHGVDDSADGVLDAGEIDGTSFICNGVDGIDGLQTLVVVTAEAGGVNCADGGQRIDQGLDVSADGVLDAGEIDNTSFVCNGAGGIDGLGSLVAVSAEAAGVDCIAGGSRIEAGSDTNNDGVLDAGEVTSTSFACNGLQSLVFSSGIAAGGACGALAGTRLDMGLDLNNDGALQAGEISTSAVVCDGADGTDGNDGFEALVNQTAIAGGGVCGAATGVQVDSGIDANRNGSLEAGEIADTAVLCNGADGSNGAPGNDGLTSLVLLTAEPAGVNCSDGGTRIEAGVDSNGNSSLEAGEITSTGFACNFAPPVGFIGTVGDLTLNNCTLLDFTQTGFGDDRGGIAIASGDVFVNHDLGTGHFDSELVGGFTELPGAPMDANFAPWGGSQLFSMSTSAGATHFSFASAFPFTFDSIVEYNPANLGAGVVSSFPLSQSITVSSGNDNGFYTGPDFVILMTTTNFFHIDMFSGSVTDLGARPGGVITPQQCETWASGGIAEFDGVDFSILYRQVGSPNIMRHVIGSGAADQIFVTLPGGNPVNDMCGFTVDPINQRWYFHHEGAADVGGIEESVTFCDAAIF